MKLQKLVIVFTVIADGNIDIDVKRENVNDFEAIAFVEIFKLKMMELSLGTAEIKPGNIKRL